MASIKKRGEGYLITVSLGRDIYGKKLFQTTTYRPEARTPKAIEKEVARYADDFERRVLAGKYLDGDKVSFYDFMQIWEKDWASQNLTQRAQEDYKRALKHFALPVIGHLKIGKIAPTNVQGILTDMLRSGLSPATVKYTYTSINSVMKYAYRMEVIAENPCSRCQLPKQRRSEELHYFTLEQAQRFIGALSIEYHFTKKGHKRTLSSTGEEYTVPDYDSVYTVPLQFKAYFLLAIYGAFRRGEMIALTWNDINFEKKTVAITKAISRVEEGEITKGTKTVAGKRTIILPSQCFTVLRQLRKEQKARAVELGQAWEGYRGDDYDMNRVFIQWDNGRPMNLDTPYQRFKEIIKNYNLTVEREEDKLPDIRLHDLRHTSATLLLSEGVDIETVAKRMGHAKASITLDVYGHALEAKDKTASEKLEEMFRREA